MTIKLIVVALVTMTTSVSPRSGISDEIADARARIDFILHCSGCHGQDGTGNPTKGIPNFVGQIGHFQRLPEGREFVMQVPGLLSARLPDERAAAVTSWMIRRFAGDSLPPEFVPYSAEEARRARESRPADVMAKRNALYQQLFRMGYVIR